MLGAGPIVTTAQHTGADGSMLGPVLAWLVLAAVVYWGFRRWNKPPERPDNGGWWWKRFGPPKEPPKPPPRQPDWRAPDFIPDWVIEHVGPVWIPPRLRKPKKHKPEVNF